MISRIWHGWTPRVNADAYETLLRTEILPGIEKRKIDGYRGAHLLRRPLEENNEMEFITICWFDHWDAVKQFSGVGDYEQAVVPAKARALLARYDKRSQHYEMLVSPAD